MCRGPARVPGEGRRGEIPGASKGDQRMAVETHPGCQRLPTLEWSQDERAGRPQGLWRHGSEALPPPRGAGRTCPTIEGLPIACGPRCVTGEQGGGCEGKHGTCRHPRIVSGPRALVHVIIPHGGAGCMQQAEERSGPERFASFWRSHGHRTPPSDVLRVRNRSEESRMVAGMFPKGQGERWRAYEEVWTSGNCRQESLSLSRVRAIRASLFVQVSAQRVLLPYEGPSQENRRITRCGETDN
jgi:hypothetical protein